MEFGRNGQIGIFVLTLVVEEHKNETEHARAPIMVARTVRDPTLKLKYVTHSLVQVNII